MVIGNFKGKIGAIVPLKEVATPKNYNGESKVTDFAIFYPDWENSPYQIDEVP